MLGVLRTIHNKYIVGININLLLHMIPEDKEHTQGYLAGASIKFI